MSPQAANSLEQAAPACKTGAQEALSDPQGVERGLQAVPGADHVDAAPAHVRAVRALAWRGPVPVPPPPETCAARGCDRPVEFRVRLRPPARRRGPLGFCRAHALVLNRLGLTRDVR